VPITDFLCESYSLHFKQYEVRICKKAHDILYHGTMYHTPLNNTRFSIDAYNVLIASIYLHQCFYILKILAHSVDFNELYPNVTIHCLNICTYDTSIQLYHSVIIHNRAFVTPVCRSLIIGS
jgi:hypothetical protein